METEGEGEGLERGSLGKKICWRCERKLKGGEEGGGGGKGEIQFFHGQRRLT